MNVEAYDQKFYHDPNEVLLQENDCLSRLILENQLKAKHCLDFGCGTGYWSNFLVQNGATVVGIDSQNGLQQSWHSNGSANYAVSESATLPFCNGIFDLILVSWVFQEIVQDSSLVNAISELHRVLKKCGRLVVVDNIYPDSRKLRKQTEFGHIFDNAGQPKLLRFFPNNSVETILAKFSFELKTHKLCGHSFFEVYYKHGEAD